MGGMHGVCGMMSILSENANVECYWLMSTLACLQFANSILYQEGFIGTTFGGTCLSNNRPSFPSEIPPVHKV